MRSNIVILTKKNVLPVQIRELSRIYNLCCIARCLHSIYLFSKLNWATARNRNYVLLCTIDSANPNGRLLFFSINCFIPVWIYQLLFALTMFFCCCNPDRYMTKVYAHDSYWRKSNFILHPGDGIIYNIEKLILPFQENIIISVFSTLFTVKNVQRDMTFRGIITMWKRYLYGWKAVTICHYYIHPVLRFKLGKKETNKKKIDEKVFNFKDSYCLSIYRPELAQRGDRASPDEPFVFFTCKDCTRAGKNYFYCRFSPALSI